MTDLLQVRVLGCSGAIARDCRTTSFLVDGTLLVDAGTGVGDLTLDEMAMVDDVLLTHSHLDHIAALPLMIDAVASRRDRPLRVHALQATLDALRTHVFNNVIWPDFERIPSVEAPLVSLHPIAVGQVLSFDGHAPLQVDVLPAQHTVPACGFAARRALPQARWWVFTGDTGSNAQLWTRLNALDVGALVIETAFSDHEQALARRSRHLSPHSLAAELAQIAPGRRYPIYITHTKPAETAAIMREIAALSEWGAARGNVLDIRGLSADDILQV